MLVIQKLTELIVQSRHQLSLLLLPQPHRAAVDQVPSDDLARKSQEIAASSLETMPTPRERGGV